MPAFPVSIDDAVWTFEIPFQNPTQLVSIITHILKSPEGFLSESSHTVPRWPLFKYVFSQHIADKDFTFVNKFIKDETLVSMLSKKSPKEIEYWINVMSECEEDHPTIQNTRLFDPDDNVIVLFQYGEIQKLKKSDRVVNGIPQAETVNDKNIILVQGEYGTNAVRVFCPEMAPTGIDFNPTLDPNRPLQVTLTQENICYVHFDLKEDANDIFESIAKMAAFPTLKSDFLNKKFQNALESLPNPANPASLPNPVIEFAKDLEMFLEDLYSGLPDKNKRIEDIKKTVAAKIRFRIAGFDSDARNSSYEFIYMVQSRAKLASGKSNVTSPVISTCFKDLSTINPTSIFINPSDNTQNIWVTSQSGQMIRWSL
jgi:hypothetical protein